MGLMKELADLNAIYQKMNVTEVSADTALRASKKADVERGKAASAGDTEKAKAKAAQASRLYKASGEKRKSEPVKQPDRSYPKGKGASYKESYETQKKKEVLGAMKRQGRKLSDKDKEKIANKVVTSKGDTSKSDDRYAYEELTHLRALVEKEVKVKDTRRTVDAIRAYDKSKDASRDATYDSDEGDKEKADIEKKYAAKERGEIDKDDPNWKKRKYHTGIHGEEVEALKRLVESGKFSDEEIETMAWDVYEGYQRNPEKGEKEDRKYEKVRGERTPMPPRGNKRREEFERWYAANVR